MKGLLKVAVLIAVLVFIGRRLYDKGTKGQAEDAASKRVNALLENLKAGPAGEQTALCLWAIGTTTCAEEEMRANSNRFDDWRRDQALLTVREARITDVTLATQGGGSVPRVKLWIDNREVTWTVEKGRPIY